MIGGYIGKILRVDVTAKRSNPEPLPDEKVLRAFLGGYGLAVWYLYKELAPEVDPLSPENKLVMMNGPLTGTNIPSSSDISVVAKNPITRVTLGAGHAHGYWGANLKFAGFDGLILEGASANPTYLWINDGAVEFRDASHLWGRDIFDTIDALTKEIGDDNAIVGCIGPAAENLITFSTISMGKNHQAAKGGIGAVMGSKKVKAIVVKGTGKVPLASSGMLDQAAGKWSKIVSESWLGIHKKDAGDTRNLHELESHVGVAPARRNLTTCAGVPAMENLEKAVANGEIKVDAVGSWNCDIKCAFSMTLNSGPYKGLLTHKNGGGEPLDPVSSAIGAEDPLTFIKAMDVYQRLGLEAGGFGWLISLLYECYEGGLIGKDRTDGLELKWGNAEASMELARKTVRREGIGAEIAKGPKHLAAYIGGDAMNRIVHIKDSPINIHDWRIKQPHTLMTYAVASSGPRHEGFGAPDHDLGLENVDAFSPKTNNGFAMALGQNRILIEDSTGVCWFAAHKYMPLVVQAEAVAAATGWSDFGAEELFLIGERICQLARLFNLKHGMKPEQDYDISRRLLEKMPDGASQGKSLGPVFEKAIRDYYETRGWDPVTGRPTEEALEKVAMKKYVVMR